MSHLAAERLAALADAGPTTAEEAAHLASCGACAAEREAHRRLVALAADERTRLAPPLTDWTSLREALVADGTIEAAPAAAPLGTTTVVRRRPPFSRRTGLRAAAALLFVAGGAVAGRVSAGAPPLPGFEVAPAADVAPRRVGDAGATMADTMLGAADAMGRLVADTTVLFRTTTEALIAMARAERQYQLAAAFLLEHDSVGIGAGRMPRPEDSPSVYQARLAALDNVVAASREALYEAPHDPVINRYYLATLGAREATLRQLNTALPAGAQLTRY